MTKQKKSKISEQEIVKQVLAAFNGDPNVRLWRRNVGAVSVKQQDGKDRFVRFAEAGQSDIWGIATSVCPKCGRETRGLHCEIEVKAPNGKLSPAQREWIEDLKRNGVIAIVFQPKDDSELLNTYKIIMEQVNVSCSQCQNRTSNSPSKVKTMSVDEFNRQYRN